MSENDNDSSASLTLNKLEEFHRKQKQLEWERRKKRNEEVDDLISKLGDPKVAEKLRIYRLVEDQFTHIEKEVERQVKAELAAKKRGVQVQNPDPSPRKEAKVGNILAKAKKFRQELVSELQCENPPEPIKDNLAKIRAERQAIAKEKILGRRIIKHQDNQKSVIKPVAKPIQSIPSKAATKKKIVKDENTGIIMLTKPIIRDLSSTEKQVLMAKEDTAKNVGYVEYFHAKDEVDSTKILSAHVLMGVNISPELVVTKTSSLKTKIIEELHHSLSESTSENNSEMKKSPDFMPEAAKESKEAEEQEEQADYSDSFEEENDDDSDEYVKNVLVPRIIETQANFTEEDSGRLSTIPEVPSQATSVEEFNKMLEEGPLVTSVSASSDSSSTSSESEENQSVIKEKVEPEIVAKMADESLQSPQPEPQKMDLQRPDIIQELSLSEGPILISDDSSLAPPNLSLSQGPLSPEEEKIFVDQAVMTSEKSALEAAAKSSSMTSSSSRQTSQSLSSSWHESSGISEGQLVLKNSLSEGEILSEAGKKSASNSTSPHDSLEQST